MTIREWICNLKTFKLYLTQDQITAVCIDLSKRNRFQMLHKIGLTQTLITKPYHIGTFEQLVGQAQSADEYVYVV